MSGQSKHPNVANKDLTGRKLGKGDRERARAEMSECASAGQRGRRTKDGGRGIRGGRARGVREFKDKEIDTTGGLG